MKQITLDPESFQLDQIDEILRKHGIHVNPYVHLYFSHPGFVSEQAEKTTVIIRSLRDICFETGACKKSLPVCLLPA